MLGNPLGWAREQFSARRRHLNARFVHLSGAQEEARASAGVLNHRLDQICRARDPFHELVLSIRRSREAVAGRR